MQTKKDIKKQPAGATAEQIKEWKAKYGVIKHIVIPREGKNPAEFIAKIPNKNEMAAMSSVDDSFKYNELMFNTLILTGDRKYIDDTPDYDPKVYLTLVKELGKLYAPVEAISTSL